MIRLTVSYVYPLQLQFIKALLSQYIVKESKPHKAINSPHTRVYLWVKVPLTPPKQGA